MCRRELKYITDLQRHLYETHRDIDEKALYNWLKRDTWAIPVKCYLCSEIIRSSGSLSKHLKEMHPMNLDSTANNVRITHTDNGSKDFSNNSQITFTQREEKAISRFSRFSWKEGNGYN